MSLSEDQATEIKSCVKACIREAVPRMPGYPDKELTWDMRTIEAFRSDVRLVLIALEDMCTHFGLDFDPNLLPQQSVFKTFPRLANLCAYLQFRLSGTIELD